MQPKSSIPYPLESKVFVCGRCGATLRDHCPHGAVAYHWMSPRKARALRTEASHAERLRLFNATFRPEVQR